MGLELELTIDLPLPPSLADLTAVAVQCPVRVPLRAKLC